MDYYIILRSITHATWLKRAFIGHKAAISLVHTPHKIPSGGCSYALQVSESSLPQILQKSIEYNVKIVGIFRKLDNGEFEKVPL